jgi:aryl-alcohol dehydrogenase-like predicted oxidoreductase
MICLGGWHIGAVQEKAESIRIMHAALDEGITFFDNAWDYHNGKSEEWMGDALSVGGKRAKVFLMTKNCERDYEGSLRCLEDSLRRLRTDHIDLWQFHEINYDNDPDWIFAEDGAIACLVGSRAGGLGRHHDPHHGRSRAVGVEHKAEARHELGEGIFVQRDLRAHVADRRVDDLEVLVGVLICVARGQRERDRLVAIGPHRFNIGR